MSLSNNKVEELPDQIFHQMVNVEEIAFRDNKIKFLRENLFSKNLKLKELYMYDNKFEALSPIIFGYLGTFNASTMYGTHKLSKKLTKSKKAWFHAATNTIPFMFRNLSKSCWRNLRKSIKEMKVLLAKLKFWWKQCKNYRLKT